MAAPPTTADLLRLVPEGAQAIVAIDTTAYVSRRTSVEMTAARPGVVAGSFVSSLTETALSQPQ